VKISRTLGGRMWGYFIAAIAICFVLVTIGEAIQQFWPWMIVVIALCLILSMVIKIIRHDKAQRIVVLAVSLAVMIFLVTILPLRLASYCCTALVTLAFYAAGAIVCKSKQIQTSGKFVCALMPAAAMVTIAAYEPDFMSVTAAIIGVIASIWITSDV